MVSFKGVAGKLHCVETPDERNRTKLADWCEMKIAQFR